MRDSRLDLGRYITNPFNRRGDITKRLDFDDLFKSKAATVEYPFNPSRFESKDLTKRAMSQKLTQNPGLNYAPNTPFFDNNEKATPDYQGNAFDVVITYNIIGIDALPQQLAFALQPTR